MTIKVLGSYVLQNALASTYKSTCPNGMLFNTITPPTTGAATGEVASASYARVANAWAASPTNGAIALSTNSVFSLTSGDAVGAFGMCTSSVKTTADVLDWYAFASVQNYSSNGTFSVSATATVS